jgi:hypothetical protein
MLPACRVAGGIVAHLNIVKLCVGAETVQDLADWQRQNAPYWAKGTAQHVTRMFPRREAEILGGGSLYWVIKGVILARQEILDLQPQRGSDGIERCAIILNAQIIHTHPAPRRAFQGWRYLEAADSPPDLPQGRAAEAPLPQELARALAEMGLR